MKITKYILIYTISFCIAAHGMGFAQVCMGPDHCDSDIDWVSNCHMQTSDSHDSHESSFGHKGSKCIDISITSIASSFNNNNSVNQQPVNKPLTLKISTPEHPFYAFDFSKLKRNIFPLFSDMTFLSIASTILII